MSEGKRILRLKLKKRERTEHSSAIVQSLNPCWGESFFMSSIIQMLSSRNAFKDIPRCNGCQLSWHFLSSFKLTQNCLLWAVK